MPLTQGTGPGAANVHMLAMLLGVDLPGEMLKKLQEVERRPSWRKVADTLRTQAKTAT